MKEYKRRLEFTIQVYEMWKEKKEGNSEHQNKQLFLLRFLNPPEEFISSSELEFMTELNGNLTNKGKYLTQIECDTSLSYPTVLSIDKRLREREIIEKRKDPTRRGNHTKRVKKTAKKYIILTERGILLLKIWKEIYKTLKI